jgi:murein DD-endopeptidase MepM/ murein hydrolase activator NlpD
MRLRAGGLMTLLVVIGVMGGFGFLLLTNAEPSVSLRAVIPTENDPSPQPDAWQDVLRSSFGSGGTVLPTPILDADPFVAPTLPPSDNADATAMPAAALNANTLPPVSVGSTPTLPPTPTPTFESTNVTQVSQSIVTPIADWQPPPLPVPLSRDPLGRDHYWFLRPVDSNANNRGLWYYPFGSDGIETANPSRIHHGIDIGHNIGQPVRAAGNGTVIFASSADVPYFQNTFSYGNVVVIEHEFGWNNQPLWTLYAHLATVLVQTGQVIEAGTPIGVMGESGNVTGPHVHFEIRLGENSYGSAYNPVLWMAPYVGHGTVVGQVLDSRGQLIDDIDVTLFNANAGYPQARTTTYIFDGTANEVNSDPGWQENFAFGDVPVGRYQVIVVYDGVRLIEVVDVREGMTSFVLVEPSVPATAQPVTPES